MVNIGKLKERVTFLDYREKEESETGAIVQELVPYVTLWANVQATKEKEEEEIQRIVNKVTYQIETRYHKKITEDMLVRYKNHIFQIESMINLGEQNEVLQFTCTEKKQGKSENKNEGADNGIWN